MNPINRDALIEHSWDILLFILFQPQTQMALWLYLSVGLLVAGFTLGKAHGLSGEGFNSPLLGILCFAIGGFALVEIAALMQIYAIPMIKNAGLRMPALIASVIASFLLMIVPFTRMWFRSGYGATMVSWCLALVIGVLTVFGLKQAHNPKPEKPGDALESYGSFGGGKSSPQKTPEPQEGITPTE
jgi:hypothetical protein